MQGVVFFFFFLFLPPPCLSFIISLSCVYAQGCLLATFHHLVQAVCFCACACVRVRTCVHLCLGGHCLFVCVRAWMHVSMCLCIWRGKQIESVCRKCFFLSLFFSLKPHTERKACVFFRDFFFCTFLGKSPQLLMMRTAFGKRKELLAIAASLASTTHGDN